MSADAASVGIAQAERSTPFVPSETWRKLARDAAPRCKAPRGLDAAWYAAAGSARRLAKRQGHYLRQASKVVDLEPRHRDVTDAVLEEQTGVWRERFRLGDADAGDLPPAFAVLREVAWRVLGLRPHPEQIAASLVITDGGVAEMATGEGKTLSTALAAVIAGWRGRGCHVLTFNDYLAARDAESMSPVFAYCGLEVASIETEMEGPDRLRAYLADVTYCTSQDVAGDFLRDRLALGRRTRLAAALVADLADREKAVVAKLLLRGLDTAIVDEADAVLIDEAVTPLIISGEAPNADQVEAFQMATWAAERLRRDGDDYIVDERRREVRLTDAGEWRLEELLRPMGSTWLARRRRDELVVQALAARTLFHRGEQYVVDDGKVVIVDESTGRLMPDRTWRSGLHQAVEAKEGLEINAPKETLARISFQRFFRMYGRLGGTSGTIREARHELWQVYGLSVVILPTHRPCRRELLPARVLPDDASKWAAVVDEIGRVHAEGRPVLVGTRSVEASESLSSRLTELGLENQVLNAVRHADEARVVARAGERGRVTVATNMAGRGTDIKLGEGIVDLGGLHVVATERHESPRIDRQLFGRSARQGDPGSAVSFASLDDEICERYATPTALTLARRSSAAGAAQRVVTAAQRRAERVASQQRAQILRSDDWLDRYLGFAGRG